MGWGARDLEVGGERLVADEEAWAVGTGGALDLDGLVGAAPAQDAEGGGLFGVGVAGGGAVERGAVDAG